MWGIDRIGRKLETGCDLVGRWPRIGVASATASSNLSHQRHQMAEDGSEVVLQRKSL